MKTKSETQARWKTGQARCTTRIASLWVSHGFSTWTELLTSIQFLLFWEPSCWAPRGLIHNPALSTAMACLLLSILRKSMINLRRHFCINPCACSSCYSLCYPSWLLCESHQKVLVSLQSLSVPKIVLLVEYIFCTKCAKFFVRMSVV